MSWSEAQGSPIEQFGLSGSNVTRILLGPWSDRINLAIAFFQRQSLFGVGPAVYPVANSLFVDSIKFEPLGDLAPDAFNMSDPVSQLASYNAQEGNGPTCRATITYKNIDIPDQQSQDQQLPEGTYATYRAKFSGEFLTVPGRALKWEDNEEQVSPDIQGVVLIPLNDHVITWNKVPYPPFEAINRIKGSVNQQPFKIPVLNRTVPAECLLFEGSEVDKDVPLDPFQPQPWKLTYTMREKLVTAFNGKGSADDITAGWNHVYRDDPPGWARPLSGDEPLYVMNDFQQLFQV